MPEPKQPKPPDPPPPPPFQRRIEISALQLCGIGLLMLLPIGALSGLLGTKEHEASASAGPLALTARYPARLHHQRSESMELQLKNTGSQTLATATLRIDGAYLDHFEQLQFRPPVQRMDEAQVEVELGPLPPGQTRKLIVEMRPNDYGTHDGRVSASADGGAPVSVELSTLVLP